MRLEMVSELAVNYHRYGIERSKRSIILNMIDDTIFLNLTSSRNATFINIVKPTYTREETYKPEDAKKSAWSWIPFIGGSKNE